MNYEVVAQEDEVGALVSTPPTRNKCLIGVKDPQNHTQVCLFVFLKTLVCFRRQLEHTLL